MKSAISTWMRIGLIMMWASCYVLAGCGGSGSKDTDTAPPVQPQSNTPNNPPAPPNSNPPDPDPNLPSWVPAAGDAISYAVDPQGVLINSYASQIASYYEKFYAINSVNAYSSAVANPYHGAYGASYFIGGGHAGTNYNGVIALVPSTTSLTFVSMSDPTPYFGTGTDATTRSNNANGNVNSLSDHTYGEPLSNIDTRKIAPSAHTFRVGDFIGPMQAGATYGTYIRPGSVGWLAANSDSVGDVHQLSIFSLTESSSNLWARATDATIAPNTIAGGPHFSAWVPEQNRVYYFIRTGTKAVRWFDWVTKTLVTGTGTSFDFDTASDPDSGALLYVAERNLLIAIQRVAGTLRFQWMDVSVLQPTLGGTATLTAPLTVQQPGPNIGGMAWDKAYWCPDNHRIMLGAITLNGTLDTAAQYSVVIPQTLTDVWTVTRHPFTSDTVTWGGGWQAPVYLPKIKSALFFPIAHSNGADVVYVIRPPGT